MPPCKKTILSVNEESTNNKAVKRARHAVGRRYEIGSKYLKPVYSGDCEYTADEMEYMRAVEEFKNRVNRRFPTCCEHLAIARDLGYEKTRVSLVRKSWQ